MMGQSVPQARPGLAALPDEEVVQRVLQGETALLEILMRRYNQRLYRVARGIVADPAEAEDVTQEAYVRAFRQLASFRGEASFSTWLTRIAVHEGLARVRKRRRFVPIEGGAQPEAPTAGPDRELENRELRNLLRQVVDALPDLLRPVFVLREVEGLSSAETATALGISEGNVRQRLHRAKALLKERIDDRIGQEARRLYMFEGQRCDRLVEAVFARLEDG